MQNVALNEILKSAETVGTYLGFQRNQGSGRGNGKKTPGL
jgi:hypothetical protein